LLPGKKVCKECEQEKVVGEWLPCRVSDLSVDLKDGPNIVFHDANAARAFAKILQKFARRADKTNQDINIFLYNDEERSRIFITRGREVFSRIDGDMWL